MEIYKAAICANPSAAKPTVTAAATGVADVTLSWADDAGNVNGYQISYSGDPHAGYQYLGLVNVGITRYTHVNGRGNVAGNNYYIVQGLGNCLDASANSNVTGEFDFAISPGS